MYKRLDEYLVLSEGISSREKAKAVIMSGIVYINNQKAEKAGAKVQENDHIEIRGETLKYVSRGGLKLEKAMLEWGIDFKDKTCLDIGASTGGFTDCMLQNGASKVYAVDVGYGQLAYSLRNNQQVVCLERTNVKNLTKEQVPQKIDFFSVDISFISLTSIFDAINSLDTSGAVGVLLIKPQFEAGREFVGKNGVVKEKSTHIYVIEKIVSASTNAGFYLNGLSYSPVKGPKGNIEFLLYVSRALSDFAVDAKSLVDAAHLSLV